MRPSSRPSLRSNLTLRYALALGLIACTLLFTHALSMQRISATATTGRLIDVSGMQRMLAQRIGLLSLELVAGRGDVADSARRLDVAVARMGSNHAELVADWRARVADGQRDYASSLTGDGVSGHVDAFLDAVRSLLAARRATPAGSGYVADALRVASIARGDVLLGELDAVVKRYDRGGVEASSVLERIQRATLAAGLCLLALEALLIFRPMVSRIASTMEALDHANEELRGLATRLSHDLRAPIVDSIGLVRLVDEALASGKVTSATNAATSLYSSMITMSGVLDELLDVVRRHREHVLGARERIVSDRSPGNAGRGGLGSGKR